MTTIQAMTLNSRGGMLMFLVLLLFLQLFALLAAGFLGMSRLHRITGGQFLFLLFWLAAVRCLHRELQLYGNGKSAPAIWVGGCPVAVLCIFLAAEAVWTFGVFWKLFSYWKNRITPFSIKESIDNLPAGLAFAEKSGFVLLANRQMEQLSHQIAGMDFQNAEEFWEILTKGELSAGCCRIQDGTEPEIQLSDGLIWIFARHALQVEGRMVLQFTASEMTEQFLLAEKLAEDNEALRKMNDRLRRYDQELTAFVRSREILDAKMQIHNEMGRALLATRAWLGQNSDREHAHALWKQWEYVTALLRAEAKPRQKRSDWTVFVESARMAGVSLQVNGDVPEASSALELIAAAAAEALTNAVRHAGADMLVVCMSQTDSGLEVSFKNNGKVPERTVTEGGGLGALRLRVEQAGGSVQIVSFPQFCLTIQIPVAWED